MPSPMGSPSLCVVANLPFCTPASLEADYPHWKYCQAGKKEASWLPFSLTAVHSEKPESVGTCHTPKRQLQGLDQWPQCLESSTFMRSSWPAIFLESSTTLLYSWSFTLVELITCSLKRTGFKLLLFWVQAGQPFTSDTLHYLDVVYLILTYSEPFWTERRRGWRRIKFLNSTAKRLCHFGLGIKCLRPAWFGHREVFRLWEGWISGINFRHENWQLRFMATCGLALPDLSCLRMHARLLHFPRACTGEATNLALDLWRPSTHGRQGLQRKAWKPAWLSSLSTASHSAQTF